jgi:hypothetical protein
MPSPKALLHDRSPIERSSPISGRSTPRSARTPSRQSRTGRNWRSSVPGPGTQERQNAEPPCPQQTGVPSRRCRAGTDGRAPSASSTTCADAWTPTHQQGRSPPMQRKSNASSFRENGRTGGRADGRLGRRRRGNASDGPRGTARGGRREPCRRLSSSW